MRLFSPLLVLAIVGLARAAAAQTPDTVQIGNLTKKAVGTVTSLQTGDIACYITLKDDKGATFREMADFEICEQRSLVNRRVALTYAQRRVQSPECQGDESCKKSITVALVTQARPVATTSPTSPARSSPEARPTASPTSHCAGTRRSRSPTTSARSSPTAWSPTWRSSPATRRSEEHTSELQSH